MNLTHHLSWGICSIRAPIEVQTIILMVLDIRTLEMQRTQFRSLSLSFIMCINFSISGTYSFIVTSFRRIPFSVSFVFMGKKSPPVNTKSTLNSLALYRIIICNSIESTTLYFLPLICITVIYFNFLKILSRKMKLFTKKISIHSLIEIYIVNIDSGIGIITSGFT